MNAIVRQPVVGGVDGGVGTTTVAAMIDALDAGRIAPDGTEIVDILVARATAASVKAAIFTAAAMPVRPVLVVVAHSSDRWSPPVEQRLKMVEPNLPAVVRMGWISYLAACDTPGRLSSRASTRSTRRNGPREPDGSANRSSVRSPHS
ncbi:hypothetical protein GS584_02925 [Rhodococcus hoagii]|nr:hypothetical protein [Prescottella equi]